MEIKESDRYCNARNRNLPGYCKRPAGWGTWHVGVGRCKLHGGATPVKHGLYSKNFKELYWKRRGQFKAREEAVIRFWDFLSYLIEEYVPEVEQKELMELLGSVGKESRKPGV